jgi:peptidyl-tRNA hydrolase, PTH1 family
VRLRLPPVQRQLRVQSLRLPLRHPRSEPTNGRQAMLLLVGLGNPGARHVGNRHNIGFMVVEAIAKHHRIAPWRRRFQGVAAEGPIGNERVQLLLPGTFMNESGRAVAEAMHFYKLALSDLIVFHDELDLPPGKVRVKVGGGVAGHNGLRSVSAHVGNDYRRVRIGIGHPGQKELVQPYVLSDFYKDERPCVAALCDAIADNAELLTRNQDASFQNKIHLAMVAQGFGESKELDEADE